MLLCVAYRDDTRLSASFKIRMTVIGETYTLTISGVTMKMSGAYRCVATNKKGTVEHSAIITISDGKTKKKPEEKKTEEKIPEEKVEETKPVEKKPEMKKTEEKKLETKKPEEQKPEENKLAEAEPVSAQGVEEAVAQLIVEEPKQAPPAKPIDTGVPKFVEVFEEITVLEKKTLTLKVKVIGKPVPVVEWFRYVVLISKVFVLSK